MVAALGEAARPHPQTVAAALALAKRYCRDDQFNVQWHEFLSEEVARLRRFVTGPEYPTAEPVKTNINQLIAEIVGRSEVLRRVLLLCARWGTPAANQTPPTRWPRSRSSLR
jgi:hypothetical protein